MKPKLKILWYYDVYGTLQPLFEIRDSYGLFYVVENDLESRFLRLDVP
jgi:hypothetical protein